MKHNNLTTGDAAAAAAVAFRSIRTYGVFKASPCNYCPPTSFARFLRNGLFPGLLQSSCLSGFLADSNPRLLFQLIHPLPRTMSDPTPFSHSNLQYCMFFFSSFPPFGIAYHLMANVLRKHRLTTSAIYLFFGQSVSMFRTHTELPT